MTIYTSAKWQGNTGKFWALNIKTETLIEVTPTTYSLLPRNEEEAKKKGNRYCQIPQKDLGIYKF